MTTTSSIDIPGNHRSVRTGPRVLVRRLSVAAALATPATLSFPALAHADACIDASTPGPLATVDYTCDTHAECWDGYGLDKNWRCVDYLNEDEGRCVRTSSPGTQAPAIRMVTPVLQSRDPSQVQAAPLVVLMPGNGFSPKYFNLVPNSEDGDPGGLCAYGSVGACQDWLNEPISYEKFAEHLASHGYVVAILGGTTNVGGDGPELEWLTGDEWLVTKRAYMARSALVNYLFKPKTQAAFGYDVSEGIGLVGHSQGGEAAVLLANALNISATGIVPGPGPKPPVVAVAQLAPTGFFLNGGVHAPKVNGWDSFIVNRFFSDASVLEHQAALGGVDFGSVCVMGSGDPDQGIKDVVGEPSACFQRFDDGGVDQNRGLTPYLDPIGSLATKLIDTSRRAGDVFAGHAELGVAGGVYGNSGTSLPLSRMAATWTTSLLDWKLRGDAAGRDVVLLDRFPDALPDTCGVDSIDDELAALAQEGGPIRTHTQSFVGSFDSRLVDGFGNMTTTVDNYYLKSNDTGGATDFGGIWERGGKVTTPAVCMVNYGTEFAHRNSANLPVAFKVGQLDNGGSASDLLIDWEVGDNTNTKFAGSTAGFDFVEIRMGQEYIPLFNGMETTPDPIAGSPGSVGSVFDLQVCARDVGGDLSPVICARQPLPPLPLVEYNSAGKDGNGEDIPFAPRVERTQSGMATLRVPLDESLLGLPIVSIRLFTNPEEEYRGTCYFLDSLMLSSMPPV